MTCAPSTERHSTIHLYKVIHSTLPPSPSHPRSRMKQALRWCVVTHKALEVFVIRYGSSFSTAVRLCTPWWSRSMANTSQRYNRKASAADAPMQLGPSFAISIVTRDMRNETGFMLQNPVHVVVKLAGRLLHKQHTVPDSCRLLRCCDPPSHANATNIAECSEDGELSGPSAYRSGRETATTAHFPSHCGVSRGSLQRT